MFLVLEHAARDDAVKVLIYTATGEKAFCSGANQKGPGELHVPAVKNPEKQSKNHGNQ